MKYLLIDSNNLAVRNAFAQSSLRSPSGAPSGVHFGVFSSLIGMKQRFSDYQFLMVWDGKSKRRTIEAQEQGVKKGIVPDGYKENRKKGDDLPQELKDFHEQAPYLQRAIEQTGIPQIRFSDFEADDVIYSYCKLLKQDNEVICLTSDGDFTQLLDKNVKLWDGMKQKETTKESWEAETGLKVEQYLDVSALMGDNGDNIYGVSGIGIKTATKEIQKYGSWENAIDAYREKYKNLLSKYPDYGNQTSEKEEKEFKEMVMDAKTDSGKLKFPDVKISMPYSRVALALAKGEIKISKTELMSIMFQERIKLAYSLKKMDEVPDLPEIIKGKVDKDKILEYFDYYGIETLKSAIVLF